MTNAVPIASKKHPTNPMDWLGKIVTFNYTQPELKPFFKEQTARVVSVVVHENEPPELGLMVANLEYLTFKDIEILNIED